MSKTKIIFGVCVLAAFVGIFVSFVSPGFIRNWFKEETPDQVVRKYVAYANRGELDKLKTLVAKTPKSYRDYQAQLIADAKREREEQQRAQGGPPSATLVVAPAIVGINGVALQDDDSDSAKMNRVSQEFPRTISDENWQIFSAQQLVVKGDDARVRVSMGPKDSYSFEFDFSLHRQGSGWKIFMLERANTDKPFPRP